MTIQEVQESLMSGRYLEAVSGAADLVQANPRNAQAWVSLGEGLQLQGRNYEAWLAYERGWILDPAAAWVLRVRAQVGGTPKAPVAEWLVRALAVPEVSVAAALIVRNEARTIAAVIDHLVPAVDEIIVVDTGSTDETISIVESRGI